MIRSFSCADTEALFNSRAVARFRQIERVARRKLLQIHAAMEINSLRIPPGNRLGALAGNRKGQFSIRVNDQWRICFTWKSDGAHGVEIVDYD
ncbi:MAG: type II toxin-antitoxin system RelE/ParE family toxin [Proteobacteria bacterium]|nr:type II toxin-antitoxin system RelE/ParE family toxin [Pseudomonadota bacterium]